jgi:hypothetical protein
MIKNIIVGPGLQVSPDVTGKRLKITKKMKEEENI